MKKIFKKLLVRFTAILCSAILLFMSPCSKYMGAISMEHVQATEMVLGYYAGEIAIEWLLAFFASLGLGVAVYDNRDAIEDAFTDYLQTQEFYEEQYGSMQDSCIQVYNINTNTTQDISWQKLLDSLSEFHNDTVDNLTGLYVKYCPALLLSFEDFVNEVINGDIVIPELSVALMDDTFSDYESIQGSDGLYYVSGYGSSLKITYGSEIKLTTWTFDYGVGYRPVGVIDYSFDTVYFYYLTNSGSLTRLTVYKSEYIAGVYTGEMSSFGISIDAGYALNIPIFTSTSAARDALVSDDFSSALNYSDSTMESVIDLTKVPDLAPDIPPFTRSWQQKEWERIANAPDVIGIGSYGNSVYDDDWGDDIPWIGLESLQEYSRSLLDIYNQIIDDILNGTYDSSEDIPGTYSEAWEQAISEAWNNVEQSTDAVPGESEKDKPTDGDEDEKDAPEEGGGGSGDSNNEDDNNPKEPPEGNGNEGGIKSLYDEDGNYTGGRSKEELDELANDPAHAGSARPSDIEKGLHEREIGLDLEERVELARPIVRDPSGAAEFIDGNGQAWDVKSFHSGFSPDNGGYTLASSMKAINDSLTAGEYVILDTTYLNEADLAELLNEIFEEGLLDRIIVWP